MKSGPRAREAWIDAVRNTMRDLLEKGEVTVAAVARDTGTSPRTLQRRLAEQGTGFSEVLESVRREIALSALREGKVSMAELSRRLGYRRQSALTRAVRRWTGHAPTQFRRLRD